MHTRECVALMALVVSACVPVESIQIPDDVDWVAEWVPGASASAPVRSVREGEARPTPNEGSWLLGFTEAALTAAGLPPDAAEGIVLRPAQACDPALPAPSWVSTDDARTALGSLTSDALPPLEFCPTLDSDSFTETTSQIPNSLDTEIEGFGFTALGFPLIVLTDGRVFTLTLSLGEELNPTTTRTLAPLKSILETNWGVWALTDSQLTFGLSLESLQVIDEPVSGIFFKNRRRDVFVVDRTGITPLSLNPLAPVPRRFTGYCTFTPQVFEDESGRLIVGGADWSWRAEPDGTRTVLGLRRPFASLNGTLVYGNRTSEIVIPPDVPGAPEDIVADVGDARPPLSDGEGPPSDVETPIFLLESYGRGVIAADDFGYLTYVTRDAPPVQIRHLINIPICMFRSGRDLIVVTKDSDAQFSGAENFPTNVTISTLLHKD